MINLFNERFFVPFRLEAKNKSRVVTGQEPILKLGFTFEDGGQRVPVDEGALLQSLSTGEKKAYYILNVLFEIEARRKANQETLFVIDDIADSFDYKNKYAIIQYLSELGDNPGFKQIILTHNFDFFRTISSRFVGYKQCLTAVKNADGITLKRASGINNIFVNDWKGKFYSSQCKRVACIPFLRNLVEFTKGPSDPHFLKLTSLLHWKDDTDTIAESTLDSIYVSLCGGSAPNRAMDGNVIDAIRSEAGSCAANSDGSLEAKIVMSIWIRLAADKFMIDKINDRTFTSGLTSAQSGKLFGRFKGDFPVDRKSIEILGRVLLMTPENIHLNSFMYEPILDMNDEHLRRLYVDVGKLS